MKMIPASPKPLAGPVFGLMMLMAATGFPAAAQDPAPARPAGVTNAVDLARTPSAANVVKRDPLMEPPAAEVIVGLAGRDLGPASNKANQEAAQSRLRASERPLTVEEAGGAIRYVRRKPGWRSVAQLVNPFAPVTKPEEPAAMAFETRKRLDSGSPRVMQEGVQHESTLSIR